VVAGIISTVASLASVVSYPVLLALGLPPLSANVTNTVSLLFTGAGAAMGSRPELAGQAAGSAAWAWSPRWAARQAPRCCCSPRPGPSRPRRTVLIGAASLLLLLQAAAGPENRDRARQPGTQPRS